MAKAPNKVSIQKKKASTYMYHHQLKTGKV